MEKSGLVKAEIDGEPSLRDPVSASREALVSEAIKEWLRFEQGLGKETVDPFYKFIGEMWKAIDINLDGKDTDQPWSAAAISFMVRNAGKNASKYKKFKFGPAHAAYFHDSIVKQKSGDANAPFWGFRLHENRPVIGDIVGVWRKVPKTFENAEAGQAFKSHSDIIVSVKADFVLAIGGNVGDSVSITRYEKTPSGFLDDTHKGVDGRVIIHMVNKA